MSCRTTDDRCSFRVSPYGDVYVASFLKDDTSPIEGCVVTREVAPASRSALAAALGGASMTVLAVPLSRAPLARLLLGGAAFSLSALLVLAVVAVTRVKPGTAAAYFVLTSTTISGVMRFLYGAWLPGADQVLTSAVFSYYVASTMILGALLTAFYSPRRGSVEDDRLAQMLEWILRGGGVALVAVVVQCRWLAGVLVALALAAGALLGDGSLFLRAVLSDVARRAKGKGTGSADGEVDAEVKPTPPNGTHSPGTAPTSPDFTTPRAKTPTLSVAASLQPAAQAAPPDIAAEGLQQPVSPLVQRGLIVNMSTGKTIGIGKGTYNRLILQGYVRDDVKGMLTPPDH